MLSLFRKYFCFRIVIIFPIMSGQTESPSKKRKFYTQSFRDDWLNVPELKTWLKRDIYLTYPPTLKKKLYDCFFNVGGFLLNLGEFLLQIWGKEKNFSGSPAHRRSVPCLALYTEDVCSSRSHRQRRMVT